MARPVRRILEWHVLCFYVLRVWPTPTHLHSINSKSMRKAEKKKKKKKKSEKKKKRGDSGGQETGARRGQEQEAPR